MKLPRGLHLAYDPEVHRGESWREIFATLQRQTLAVRERICPQQPFGLSLRLGQSAAEELSDPNTLLEFQRWLAKNNCYVFNLSGAVYGRRLGTRVKDGIYNPDWTSPERVAYTNLLFDLLAELLPVDVAGSVSTLPGSFKSNHSHPDAPKHIRHNLWRCVEHIARTSEQTGRSLQLGLEPEPMGLLESSAETLHCFEHLRSEHPKDARLEAHLGVVYDTCHFAVEFEEPQNALACLVNNGIKISEIHLSAALQTQSTPEARANLSNFSDTVHLRQVVERGPDGQRVIHRDLPDALAGERGLNEWRIHCHVPLQTQPIAPFTHTADHVLAVLDLLAEYPEICPHLVMETNTWDVTPPELKAQDIVGQLAGEYAWTLARLGERGLA